MTKNYEKKNRRAKKAEKMSESRYEHEIVKRFKNDEKILEKV